MFTDLFQYAQVTVTGLETINLVYCKTFHGFVSVLNSFFWPFMFCFKNSGLEYNGSVQSRFFVFYFFYAFLTLEMLASLFPLIPKESA